MSIGGTKIYCPNCKAITVCASIHLHKMKEPKVRRFYIPKYKDVQWFRRGRECLSCNHKFLTAEVNEDFVNELVALREKLAKRNQEIINSIRQNITWVKREETIPEQLAYRFIMRSAWWLTHSSGHPVRAEGHASRVYNSSHGWTVDFGANSFLVGKAIERCRVKINKFLEEAATGNLGSLEEVKKSLAHTISGAVANSNGFEYDGTYPITNGRLIFGAQAIDVEDGAEFLIREAGLGSLLI
jgi:hypothetical protein